MTVQLELELVSRCDWNHCPSVIGMSVQVALEYAYIRSKEDAQRHFEALCGKIYKPECVIATSKGHSRIKNKSCIASAKDDKQKVMKKLLVSASKKQGLTKKH